jgi:hypothetical protein
LDDDVDKKALNERKRRPACSSQSVGKPTPRNGAGRREVGEHASLKALRN